MVAIAPPANQTLDQLHTLGYQSGDRVWVRLLLPKNISLEIAERRGLAWTTPEGKRVAVPIDGYLTLTEDGFSFTRMKRCRESGKWIESRTYQDGLNYLTAQNMKGYGVYLVVNPGGREDADITRCWTLFYECDGVSKIEQWERLHRLEQQLGRKASMVVETRNSLHVYFVLDQPIAQEVFRTFQQRLIQQQGSDPSILNPARLMRLAGFDHQRWNSETGKLEGTEVEIVQLTDSIFSPAEFDHFLPAWDAARWKSERPEGERVASDPVGDPWDIRNLSQYLEGGSSRRRGWSCFKCPAHDGVSNDSLHIEDSTGAFKCHAGCDSKAVYHAVLELAKSRGHQLPAGKRPRQIGVKPDYSLTYVPDLIVHKQYLSELPIPDDAKLVVLKSPKGTNKTGEIARVAQKALDEGKRVLLVSHRVQLTQALCDRVGIQSIYEITAASQQGDREKKKIAEKLADWQGFGLCIDSLHPNSMAQFKAEDWEDALVIWDEDEQLLWHALNSSTCKSDRVSIAREIRDLIRYVLDRATKGQLLLSDADQSNIPIDFVLKVANLPDLKPWICLNTWKPTVPWDVYRYKQKETWLSRLETRIATGERVLVLTDSQKLKGQYSTQNLEQKWRKKFPGKKILRIDSQTLELKNHPAFGCIASLNEIVSEFDIVICSPSVETGVSLDLKGHFNSVWGLFWGCLPENSVRQMLARLREPVERHIWLNETGIGTAAAGETNVKDLMKSQNDLAKTNLHLIFDASRDEGQVDYQFLQAALDCWAQMAVRINAGLLNFQHWVCTGLKEEGHNIIDAKDELDEDQAKAIRSEQRANRDGNQQEHGAALEECELITEAEAEELEDQRGKTEEEQLKVEKYRLHERYRVPVTTDLYLRDCGNWGSKLALHYFLTLGKQHLKQRDRFVRDELTDRQEAWQPDLNKSLLSVKVALLERARIPELLQKSEFRSDDQDLIELQQWAIANRQNIKRGLNVTINPPDTEAEAKRKEAADKKPDKGDSPIKVLGKLLDTIGLALTCIRKEGSRGQQVRVYQLLTMELASQKAASGDHEFKKWEVFSPDDGRDLVFEAWLQRDAERAAQAAAKQAAQADSTRESKNVSDDTVVTPANKYMYSPTDYQDSVTTKQAIPAQSLNTPSEKGDLVPPTPSPTNSTISNQPVKPKIGDWVIWGWGAAKWLVTRLGTAGASLKSSTLGECWAPFVELQLLEGSG